MTTNPRSTSSSRLVVDDVTLGYDEQPIIDQMTVRIPDGKVTAIIGPNACGKSTLLRALARLLKPRSGAVLLDGDEIHRLKTKHVARRLGLLPQGPTAPEGILVADLVARGRTPHQRLLHQWSDADEHAVHEALHATGVAHLADRAIDELSGGQRQRVWLAMVIAQDTELLLLDEPTTYLDITHQLEVLDLIATLNSDHGRTIVVVIHDLNLASRYAHHLIAMRDGVVAATGPPHEVLTEASIRDVFGLESVITTDPVTQTPLVVPIRASNRGAWATAALPPKGVG